MVPLYGSDEAFHALLDLDRDVVQRWAFVDNATQEFQGEPFEGTTIDREEPFMIRWRIITFIERNFGISELNAMRTAGV